MKSKKDQIIALIAKGNLELAIDDMLNLAKQKYPHVHKMTIVISCRYYHLWKDIIIGVASVEEKEIAINKVAASLYDIIVKIPDQASKSIKY